MASGSNKICFLHCSHTTSRTTLVFHNLLYLSSLPHLILIPALFSSHAHVQKGGVFPGLLTLKWVTVVVHSKWCGWPLGFMWCVGGNCFLSLVLFLFSPVLLVAEHPHSHGLPVVIRPQVSQSCHFPATQLYSQCLQLLFDWLLKLSSQPVIIYCIYVWPPIALALFMDTRLWGMRTLHCLKLWGFITCWCSVISQKNRIYSIGEVEGRRR